MKQLTNLLAALCLSLMACSHINGMHGNWGWFDDDSIQPALSPIQQLLLNNKTDPDRLGPITVEQITAEDLANIETLKKKDTLCGMHDYLQNRPLMAKAGRRTPFDRVYGGNNPDRDDALLLKIFKAAIVYQDGPLVEIVLQNGVAPNTDLPNSVPPLFRAQSVKMAQLLVSHRASFQKVEHLWKNTILHHACREHSAELLEYYLEHAGLDVNIQRNCPDHRTPLHVWATSALGNTGPRASDLPTAQKKLALLIAAGADCARQDAQGKTPLSILNGQIAQYSRDSFWDNGVRALSTLKAELIAAMPAQIPAAPTLTNNNNQDDTPSCSICLEYMQVGEEKNTLRCAHTFHTSCINTWLAIQQICPFCRNPIAENNDNNDNTDNNYGFGASSVWELA